MPFEPQDASWRQKTIGEKTRVPGPTDHDLLVELKFSDEAIKKLT